MLPRKIDGKGRSNGWCHWIEVQESIPLIVSIICVTNFQVNYTKMGNVFWYIFQWHFHYIWQWNSSYFFSSYFLDIELLTFDTHKGLFFLALTFFCVLFWLGHTWIFFLHLYIEKLVLSILHPQFPYLVLMLLYV